MNDQKLRGFDNADVEKSVSHGSRQESQPVPVSAPAAGPQGGSGGPPIHQFPEGGAKAWLTVLGAWSIMFMTFGYVNCFGVYEAYYLSGPLKNHTPDDVAWIGSLQMFAMFSAGLVSGPLSDRLGPKVIIVPATLIYSLATLLTSLCKEYYQFILCQGVLGGIAMGFCYSPSIAVVGHYFHRKRPLVMGICSSGSALAGIILPIILDQMFNHSSLGFGWSQRIIGFIFLATSLVACVTITAGVGTRKGSYLLPEAFKKPEYSLQVAGIFFVFLGLFEPFFYLPSYAEAHGVGVGLAFHLIAILNAASFVGRIVAGGLGIKLGQFNVLSFCCTACAILIFCWLKITSAAGLIVFSILYGVFSGAVIGTMISTIPQIASHPSQIGTYIGMMSGFMGLAALIGAPVDGAMIEKYGGYEQATIFSGTVAIAGCVLILASRFAYGGKALIV